MGVLQKLQELRYQAEDCFSPVTPPRIRLVATLTSMSCTSFMPLGAILRKVKNFTRAELNAMMLAFFSQASLEYLHN